MRESTIKTKGSTWNITVMTCALEIGGGGGQIEVIKNTPIHTNHKSVTL